MLSRLFSVRSLALMFNSIGASAREARIRWLRPLLCLGVLATLGVGHPALTYAQQCNDGLYDITTGLCVIGPRPPAPEVVNDLWNAIAFSPSLNVAAVAGSFTAPENAKAAALKGCAGRANDCRIILAAHDVCVAVAFERKPGGAYRWATGKSKQEAEGNALPICMAEGPQRCTVLADCSGTPPRLLVSR